MTEPAMCPCGSEYATVEVRTDKGRAVVGKHCAAMLEMLGRLLGAEFRRRPALSVVPSGSVE